LLFPKFQLFVNYPSNTLLIPFRILWIASRPFQHFSTSEYQSQYHKFKVCLQNLFPSIFICTNNLLCKHKLCCINQFFAMI
jgi:hypothetical protein